MSIERDELDEGRPRPSGTVALRPDQLGPGEHLRFVPDHLRAEVTRLVRLVDMIANDETAIAELNDAVEKLSMRRNYEQFGMFCNMTCRTVTVHHRLEDLHVFPMVASEERYAPLIAKLIAEHAVVHDKLIAVDAALGGFEANNAQYEALRGAIHALRDALFSHLGYEDEQLPEPLGLLGVLD